MAPEDWGKGQMGEQTGEQTGEQKGARGTEQEGESWAQVVGRREQRQLRRAASNGPRVSFEEGRSEERREHAVSFANYLYENNSEERRNRLYPEWICNSCGFSTFKDRWYCRNRMCRTRWNQACRNAQLPGKSGSVAGGGTVPTHTAVYAESDLQGIKELLGKVQAESAFSNMQTLNSKASDPHGQTFYRKGEVGDWRNHFSEQQSQDFDCVYAEKLAGLGLNFDFGGGVVM